MPFPIRGNVPTKWEEKVKEASSPRVRHLGKQLVSLYCHQHQAASLCSSLPCSATYPSPLHPSYCQLEITYWIL